MKQHFIQSKNKANNPIFWLIGSLLLVVVNGIAQNKTKLTIQVAEAMPSNVSVMYYDVRYVPTPGISLYDSQYESVVFFDSETEKNPTVDIDINKPQILIINVIPKKRTNTLSYSRHLYIQPNDQLSINVNAELKFDFTGNTAPLQHFLQEYFFTEQPYNNLPQLGYVSTKSDNWEVVQGMESLQKKRKSAYQALQASGAAIPPAYNAYIESLMMTDDYLLKAAVMGKQMRNSSAAKLSVEESQKLRALCLDNFKLLSKDALLNPTYRQELKNYVLFSVAAPTDTAQKFMSAANVQKAYHKTTDWLNDSQAEQRAYLHTHWLDYMVGTLNEASLAQGLLADYKIRYPKSNLNAYFDESIKTRLALSTGQNAPDVKLKDKDNQDMVLANLKGQPVLVIFSFALKQHEANLKSLEDLYADRLTFLYVTVTPGMSFENWQASLSPRKGTAHWWASDTDADKLKSAYLSSAAYPFVLLNAQGQIIKRWIPQEFPPSKSIEKELKALF